MKCSTLSTGKKSKPKKTREEEEEEADWNTIHIICIDYSFFFFYKFVKLYYIRKYWVTASHFVPYFFSLIKERKEEKGKFPQDSCSADLKWVSLSISLSPFHISFIIIVFRWDYPNGYSFSNEGILVSVIFGWAFESLTQILRFVCLFFWCIYFF